MSVSKRIKRSTEAIVDTLQAKITLQRRIKIPKIDIIEKAVLFAKERETEFFSFLTEDSKRGLDSDDPLDFILQVIEDGEPIDYTEFDFEDQSGPI